MDSKIKIHELELDEVFCEDVLSGNKTFDIRLNNRGYQKGDHIKFIPVDAIGIKTWNYLELEHTKYEITYVLSGYGLKENYVVFSFKEVEDGNS